MAVTASPGIRQVACPAHEILGRAARDVVERGRPLLPDLTQAVLLVPDLHAAGDVARALRAAAGVPALLLPRITTLERWASEVPLDRPLASRTAREALLYRELEKRAWLQSADLWAVSGELVGLFDDLTRFNVTLPAGLQDFNRQLEQAYRARTGESLTFEARLVHELWHALAGATGDADAEAAYHLRLAQLATGASLPLYALGLGRLAPSEERFLQQYARRVPVQVYRADPEAPGNPVMQALAAAWPRQADPPGLLSRALALKSSHPQSPLAGRLRIIGAAGGEQEAQAVDVTVREWLLAGKRRIAIVVQDRLVARRARALLERAQVLVKDEAGWAFSTTSAATAIGRWLDVAGGDCYHRDLLDFMKSPFAFHDWPREARRAVVWRLEGYVREASVVSGLTQFIQLAEDRKDAEARQMLARIRQGAGMLGRGKRTLARWLGALVASLEEIGVRDGLAADSAGAQLLELLERLARDLAGDGLTVSFTDWRRWLARQLEAATFRDSGIDSPVVFTSLAATRLRSFDAVLILGADAAHLPGPDPVSMFFNQGVRAELALPTWAERVREMEDQLAALIAGGSPVVATWQCRLGGEQNLLSPLLERLNALHAMAYRQSLDDFDFLARLPAAEVRAGGEALPVSAARAPAPASPAWLPRRISASGYNSLVACPYQFYARYLLGLAQLDEVQELIEKKDYGNAVHGVLTEFHRAHPRVSSLDPDVAAGELERLSDAAFAADVARNYLAQAWLARWKALIPKYLEWQRQREGEGWTWQAGEVHRAIEVTTPRGRTVTLHGRLDRVDARAQPPAVSHQASGASSAATAAGNPSLVTHHPSPEFAVIDYKTRAQKALRDALELPGEDVQLAVYALLWTAPVTAAMFLSIDRDDVAPVALEGDLPGVVEETRARLAAMLDALADGARLPAQGIDAVCTYCEVRGLCRKDHWHD